MEKMYDKCNIVQNVGLSDIITINWLETIPYAIFPKTWSHESKASFQALNVDPQESSLKFPKFL